MSATTNWVSEHSAKVQILSAKQIPLVLAKLGIFFAVAMIILASAPLPARAGEPCDPYWYQQTGYCLVAPVNPTWTSTANSVTVTWSLDLNATEPGYTRIYRDSTLLKDFVVTGLEDPNGVDHFGDTFHFTDNGLQSSKPYTYSVCSVYGYTDECSLPINATTSPSQVSCGPGSPTDLKLTYPSWQEARVEWQLPPNLDPNVNTFSFTFTPGYGSAPSTTGNMICNQGSQTDPTCAAHQNHVTDGLKGSTFYTFKICDVNKANQTCQNCAQVGAKSPAMPLAPMPTLINNVTAKMDHVGDYTIAWKVIPNFVPTWQWFSIERRTVTLVPSVAYGPFKAHFAHLPGTATMGHDTGAVAVDATFEWRVCGSYQYATTGVVTCSAAVRAH
ncbi:MAG: hypothetical protein ACRD5M_05065 [Candidatus Acidiferrales bacterium]